MCTHIFLLEVSLGRQIRNQMQVNSAVGSCMTSIPVQQNDEIIITTLDILEGMMGTVPKRQRGVGTESTLT